jgi:hypothetical protein
MKDYKHFPRLPRNDGNTVKELVGIMLSLFVFCALMFTILYGITAPPRVVVAITKEQMRDHASAVVAQQEVDLYRTYSERAR